MPDNLVDPAPTPGDHSHLVVSRHHIDWEAGDDLIAATEGCFHHLGDRLVNGAWFLTPASTVHAPAPTAEFFRAAREARGRWLRQARQALSGGGQRREARRVVSQGRRAALAEIHPTGPEGPLLNTAGPTPSAGRRREALLSGHVARQMAFTGLMIIDGQHVPPRTWNQMAAELLAPGTAPGVAVIRRRVDLATFRAAGDPGPLKRLAREALQAHLDPSRRTPPSSPPTAPSRSPPPPRPPSASSPGTRPPGAPS